MAKVYELLDQAAYLLNDPRGQHWPRGELLGYYNAGLRQMVALVPSQFPITKVVVLIAGIRQTIEPPAVALIAAHRVVNADGSMGRVIRAVAQSALDAAAPSWAAAAPGATREVAYEPKVPKEYWVYPPSDGTARLQITTADEPAYQQVFHIVPVDTRYHGALVDYVLFRAFSKDADYANQDQRASQHLEAYMKGMGGAAADK